MTVDNNFFSPNIEVASLESEQTLVPTSEPSTGSSFENTDQLTEENSESTEQTTEEKEEKEEN